MTEAATGPLAGVRVIDITSVVSGPVCAALLADQGADVIKIEPPEGDIARRTVADGEFTAMFVACNRGKRSVALDLKQPAARDVVQRLAATADVLVQNFRPGALDRLGLGADGLVDVDLSLALFEAGQDALQGVHGHPGAVGAALAGGAVAGGGRLDQRLARRELALGEAAGAMREAQALAHVGNWSWDIERDEHQWSAEIYSIYGRDRSLGPARVPEVSSYFTAEGWATIQAAVDAATSGDTIHICADRDWMLVTGRGS